MYFSAEYHYDAPLPCYRAAKKSVQIILQGIQERLKKCFSSWVHKLLQTGDGVVPKKTKNLHTTINNMLLKYSIHKL